MVQDHRRCGHVIRRSLRRHVRAAVAIGQGDVTLETRHVEAEADKEVFTVHLDSFQAATNTLLIIMKNHVINADIYLQRMVI